ncbi:acetolactate synthase large subunit [Scopulibacillus darangshiensis]|uniref:Acetolactate synthase large subunit n=1 Tax=Scopulibacillus darangshiensis TaxID=442528 RepID=A0A4R2NRZ3_9BACL|nr:acetolactate synthase large subunit [Scopulibacillus darangshiensis]TCP24522.1 acetolactate synthase large subunit [Scopulibacillus darangshiensis]
MRSAELLLKCLENEGVEYIFGVPGEENLDVMDALLESKIKFITTRHETGAAFMAGIMGRLTGKPGVCLATLGPGATNMLTGVADGNMDRTPIVAITGQAGLNRLHKESHQAYDLIAMYHPVTKWNARISKPDTVPEIVRKAFKIATNEKPGATHIEFPEDVAGTDVKDGGPLEVTELKGARASVKSLSEARTLINKAKHPLLLVGNGVTRTKAADELVAFAEKIQAPVTETFMGKGAISWTHPLSLMTVGLTFKDYITCGLEKTDLLIAIGYDMTEIPPQRFNPEGKIPVLHIDTKNAEVDSAYPVVCNVVGDIAENLTELTESVDKRNEPVDFTKPIRKQILDEFDNYEKDTNFPLKPQKVVYDLRKVLGEGDITLSDTGAHKMWMARMYHCYEPNTCLISNGLASMGISVPGAIAAKIVHPEKQVVAVVGDGAFLMQGCAELETAVRLKLPIVILIWRDNAYGLIEWKQELEFDRSSNIKFGNPDFVKLAESFGAKGIRIEKAEDLQHALKEAVGEKRPVVIDCPVDYSENVKLTERLKKLDCD